MKATNINGVTDLIINKIDILEKVGVFKLIDGYDIREFTNLEDFKDHIRDLVTIYCPTVEHVNFSDTPFDI
jgi:adenylosuccinate synthase